MDFDVIVFDTAPTGHTLRFLNFPNILEKGLDKLLTFKEKFNSLLDKVGNTLSRSFCSLWTSDDFRRWMRYCLYAEPFLIKTG